MSAPWIQNLGWLVALALLIFLVLIWLRTWYRARAWARRHQARIDTARVGEDRSVELLEEQGFEILDSQVTFEYQLEVDDDLLPITLRCDHLVARDGQRFVAEVKTGNSAPNPRLAATRRQLLEYRVAYRVDGVLLVDMDREQIMRIRFPGAAN